MVNKVQQRMEAMIPELEAYREEGIFTEKEIYEIVENRKRYESRLSRRISKLEDYIRLVKYEIELEHKRRSRTSSKKYTTTIIKSARKIHVTAKFAITKRIHAIFRAALKKHHGDINLWLTWIDVAKFLGSTKIVSQLFGSAIQKHPTQVGFWIMAASYEANELQNPLSARGLRINPESVELWLEFFRFEVIFALLRKISNDHSPVAKGSLPLSVISFKKSELPTSFLSSSLSIYKETLSEFSRTDPEISLPLLEDYFLCNKI